MNEQEKAARAQLNKKAEQHANAMLMEVQRFSGLLEGEARTLFLTTLAEGITRVEHETDAERGARAADEVAGQVAHRMTQMTGTERAEFQRVLIETLAAAR